MNHVDTAVVYFFFNRPEKTKLSFSPIKSFKPKVLYLVADGPKSELDAEKLGQCKEIVRAIDWECEVYEIYSEHNLTCGVRIISALDEVFSRFERAIIIEDDVVVNDDFFAFCENNLETFANDYSVMQVCGWNPLVQYEEKIYSSFLNKYVSFYGWATWRRAWQLLDKNPSLDNRLVKESLENYFGVTNFQAKLNYHIYLYQLWKKYDPWGFLWSLCIFLNRAYVLTSTVNLVKNIGFDSEGTHYTKFNLQSLNPICRLTDAPNGTKISYDKATEWFDESASLYLVMSFYEDSRKVLLLYRNKQLIPKTQNLEGWECQFEPLVRASQSLAIIEHLRQFIYHTDLLKLGSVFSKLV